MIYQYSAFSGSEGLTDKYLSTLIIFKRGSDLAKVPQSPHLKNWPQLRWH